MAELKRKIIAEFSAKNKAKGEMASFRKGMDRTGQAMKRMAMGALAAVGGLAVLKRGFTFVIKAAMKQEDAVFLLGAALKSAGDYTDAAMKQFEAFAASIQKVTIYGDEEVLALMQLMKSLGVTSNALEQATRMAIGLAAATGRDVKSMSMYIALAQQGEFTMLRRYIPALRSTTDATEQLRIITEFAASGFKIAEAQAKTASGALAQMRNAFSDLAEIIGGPLADAMAENARGMTKYMKQHETWFGRYIADVKEGTDIWWDFWKAVAGYTPGALIYKGLTKPEIPPPPKKPIRAGIVRFEEPEWVKATLALDVMTEAQKKAAASMYEMSMKARGLGDELAREKELTKFSALAKVRYGADVAGAQAAQERFTKALKETEAAQIAAAVAAAVAAKEMADARERELEQIRLEEQRWDDVARAMEDSFANAFEAMAFEGKKFGDVMKVVAREIYMEMMRIMVFRRAAQALAGTAKNPGLLQMGFSALMGGLFSGGAAGMAAAGTVTPQAGAMYARYQHGGVAARPHLAMVGEVPEAIVPLSGGRSIPVEMRGGGGERRILEINVQYHGQEKPEISAVEEYVLSDRRIIEVTMRAAETDGPYRRSIKQASRG